jgi:diguanylate cyclase (GGDEF)-like protein
MIRPPLRVLLVEDDEKDQQQIRTLLNASGGAPIELECVSTDENAREAIARNHHDAYLIGHQLGDRDGLGLLRAAVAGGCKAPLLFLTSKDRADLGPTALTVGAVDYLVKEEMRPELLERSLRYALDRRRAEVSLEQARADLHLWAQELEQRSREITLLGELSSLLQPCLTTDEAYQVIAASLDRLFPGEPGTLFVLREPAGLLLPAAVWGDPALPEREYTRDDCWALRRGCVHAVEPAGVLCAHARPQPGHGSLCVPLIAQGTPVGVLHLQPVPSRSRLGGEQQLLAEAKRRLAVTVGEQVGLALANLHLRENLREQAIRDPLTGLFNRRHMQESLDREFHRAHRRQRPLGLILLDLDHFKKYNDTRGHQAGDALLRVIGEFLQTHIRGEDIACRYGGEEFLLILTDSALEDTRRRAEQLREGIKALPEEQRGMVTASLGVAVFPEHGFTASAVLRAADAALYQAKDEGRDRVVVGQLAALGGPHLTRFPLPAARKV